jgi:pilus assembly protein CpaB
MKLPPGSKYFILAGAAGLLAVFLVRSFLVKKITVPLQATRQVVVAEAEITPGTSLSGRLLRVATWPVDIVPSKAVAGLKELEGRVASTFIAKGEPILLTKLAPEGSAAGLGGLLAPDHLAVTVKTDEVSGVAGFVSPGDRIDVLVEMPSSGAGNEPYSKLILQNLKVLSKGQITDQSTDRKPQVVQTVTLEVTPEQAEILNLATNQGKIRLALRNQLNKGNFATAGVVTSQLRNKPVVQAKPAPPMKQEGAIRIIKGMSVSDSKL